MPRQRRRILAIVAVAVGLGLLAAAGRLAWAYGRCLVTVENASADTIRAVTIVTDRGVVRGQEETFALGDLPPGERRTIRIRPHGEREVSVRFKGRNGPVESPPAYVEPRGGYRVHVRVDASHAATTHTWLDLWPFTWYSFLRRP